MERLIRTRFLSIYHLSSCLSINLSINLSTNLSTDLSTDLTTNLTINLSINLSIYLSINLSAYLSICRFIVVIFSPSVVWLDLRTQSTVESLIDKAPGKDKNHLRVRIYRICMYI